MGSKRDGILAPEYLQELDVPEDVKGSEAASKRELSSQREPAAGMDRFFQGPVSKIGDIIATDSGSADPHKNSRSLHSAALRSG
jgi:hypothetical protein